MKFYFGILLILGVFCSCDKQSSPSLEGTWQLISATSTEKDSTFSTFNSKVKMIKIINLSHFAFLSHDITGAKDSTRAAYTAGGGTYTLKDSLYTENLEYFSDPQWENHKFEFVVKIQNDTLVQRGVEKLEKLGIDRVIVEKYVRVK
ncbi:MAG: hypothetical protein Q8K92_13915 [Leadbetterella sp.]|nr:hypothetical protein [Leadbetterella sp.]